ncbi:hypothetical protein AW43_11285 [Pasteurella multocida subsp. multocida PMTB2.1]|nr:hypothetical protein AW43_11285 [Pasteurella multocida subsp. multocida PMTB2.1]
MEKIKPSFLKNCGLSTLFLIPHSLHAANHLNIYCTLQNDCIQPLKMGNIKRDRDFVVINGNKLFKTR